MNLYAKVDKYNYIRYTIYISSPAVLFLACRLIQKAKNINTNFVVSAGNMWCIAFETDL